MKNRQKFAEAMSALCEIFDKNVSEILSNAYWELLSPYTDEQCIDAFGKAIRQLKFFPKPCELIEFITGLIADRAVIQADIVLAEIQHVGYTGTPHFDDPVTAALVERGFGGGWVRLCQNMKIEDNGYFRRDFADRYAAYSRHAEELELPAPASENPARQLAEGIAQAKRLTPPKP